MKRVSDLLYYGRSVNYTIGDLYDNVIRSWREYTLLRDESKPFPFNYGINIDDIDNNSMLVYYLERMESIGINFSTITAPKLPDDIAGMYPDTVKLIKLQSLVRFIFRMGSSIDGRTTSALDGDSKMVRFSDYCDMFLKMAGYKCDIGTFIESLNMKLSAEKPWRFVLYDAKDIPQGYANNLCTSCMTTNAYNGHKTLQFYTMFDNIKLLVIEQDKQEISRCLIWKVGKDKWIADRIYSYKNQIDMRSKVFDIIDKSIEIYNKSNNTNETIRIIDMRKSDEAQFFGFMKGKLYASVQHLTGDIKPVTLSPFFDSTRLLTIHKKYCTSLTFLFTESYENIAQKSPDRNIYIRDREETIMRQWTLFRNGSPITDKSNILRIGNDVLLRSNLRLLLDRDNSFRMVSGNDIAECSLITLPMQFTESLSSIAIKDFDNNPIDINTIIDYVKVWVHNDRLVYCKTGFVLKEDAALLVSPVGDIIYKLVTGSKVRADIVSKYEVMDYTVLSELYSPIGKYNGMRVFVEQEFATMTLDGNSVYIDDATEISDGMYCLHDTYLRGIENAQHTI